MKRPFIRGPITPFRGLTTVTMVINHLLTGMILQAWEGRYFPTIGWPSKNRGKTLKSWIFHRVLHIKLSHSCNIHASMFHMHPAFHRATSHTCECWMSAAGLAFGASRTQGSWPRPSQPVYPPLLGYFNHHCPFN